MAVLVEDYEVIPRLIQVRLPKEVLLEILDWTVGERANVTASDPTGTAGTEMRRWCTRFLRDHPNLRELGWIPCSHSQVHGIRNDALKMKVAFMNTDARTGMVNKMPHSVAERGAVSELLIRRNFDSATEDLFGDAHDARDPILDYDFWYLCCYVGDKHIAAELSRPIGLTNAIVDDYSERVILWRPGDKGGPSRVKPVPEDFAEIELPALKRR